jgi:hypothetical protein
MKKLYWTAGATFVVGLVFAAGPADAQTTACTGTLAAGSYVNVSVPKNQSCTIPTAPEVTVTGNVSVTSGAELTINIGGIVDGNIQSTGAFLMGWTAPAPGIDVPQRGRL